MLLRRLNFLKIFLGLIFLSAINYECTFKVNAEDFSKVQLNKELEKGNFLIGLKQYLGGQNDKFSENNQITFSTTKGFLNLNSSNGIKNKSKKINIIWKQIPLKKPYSIKRLVFGPYSSYESAQKQAKNLNEKGFQAIVAYPKNWEVWIPYEGNLANLDGKYKILKKDYDFQIIPFLKNDYNFFYQIFFSLNPHTPDRFSPHTPVAQKIRQKTNLFK